jgi:hypothetical protein
MRSVGIPQWVLSISLEERNAWVRSLGLEEFHHPTFHPFYHEIVEVEQALDPDEPISLITDQPQIVALEVAVLSSVGHLKPAQCLECLVLGMNGCGLLRCPVGT